MKTEKRENKLCRILRKHHTGKENAIVSKQLKGLTGKDRFGIYRAVSRLRKEGVPICSGNTGYYYPADRSEVIDVADRFRRYSSTIAATSSILMNSSEKAIGGTGQNAKQIQPYGRTASTDA